MTRYLGRIIVIYTFSRKQSHSSSRGLGRLGRLCLTLEGKTEFSSDEMLENKKFFVCLAAFKILVGANREIDLMIRLLQKMVCSVVEYMNTKLKICALRGMNIIYINYFMYYIF